MLNNIFDEAGPNYNDNPLFDRKVDLVGPGLKAYQARRLKYELS
jgi:hypothetical protein